MARPFASLKTPFLIPDRAHEVKRQVDNVVIGEGLVQFHGERFLYFGKDDTLLLYGVANAPVQP